MQKLISIATWYLRGSRTPRPTVTPELAMHVACNEGRHAWYIPTEMVVRDPKLAMGKTAKYWSVDADEIRAFTGMTKEQWPDRLEETEKPKNGVRCIHRSSSSNYAYLIQHHADHGDDGHTDYCLDCYHLLSPKDFEAYSKSMNGSGEGYYISEPETYCEACKTSTASESWVPDAPGEWGRCPNCGNFGETLCF